MQDTEYMSPKKTIAVVFLVALILFFLLPSPYNLVVVWVILFGTFAMFLTAPQESEETPESTQ